MGDKPIVFVIGPTAVGKSKLGIEISKQFNGEVISMDSMQVYKSLDILTNKVTEEETEGVPHHMLSIVEPTQQFDVSQFVTKCDSLINDIRSRGKLAVVVGGTCYYFYSLLVRNQCVGVDDDCPNNENCEKMREIEKCLLGEDLNKSEVLERIDPEAFEITKHNPKKINTYLRSYLNTGKSISELNKLSRVFYKNALVLWITSDMDVLFNRIDTRADGMVTKGLINEMATFVTANQNMDFTKSQFASIGLKQLLPLSLPSCDPETKSRCINELKSITKKYAVNQEKYIKTKFCSSERIPGLPQIFQLDASCISEWDNTVKRPAMTAVELYVRFSCSQLIEESKEFQSLAKHIIGLKNVSEIEFFKDTGSYYESQIGKTKIVNCPQCDVNIIKAQYDVHLNSRRHKKRMAGIRKREENLKRRRLL